VRTDRAREFTHFADVLLANFASVVDGRETPKVAASDVRPAVSVIERCYGQRRSMDTPWFDAYTRLTDA
jgi:hypothetical protein